MIKINLNCDLGEGIGADPVIMPYISSCNIACGGHFGTAASIKETLLLAQEYRVQVGAHPSFEDPVHFGRRFVALDQSRFRESISKQIHLFHQVAVQVNLPVHHIKMHGALYHATAYREDYAHWLVELLHRDFSGLSIYLPPKSLLQQLCESANIKYFREGFADRRYTKAGNLVARNEDAALLDTPEQISRQIYDMTTHSRVLALNGKYINIETDTICIHGDHPVIRKDLEKIIAQLHEMEIEIEKT